MCPRPILVEPAPLSLSAGAPVKLRNVVFPWFTDVGYMSQNGTVVSAIVDGAMTLSLSDNATMCLGAGTPAVNSTSRPTFTPDVQVAFAVGDGGQEVPCTVNATLSSGVRVCCTVPPMTDVCAAANVSTCMDRGVFAALVVTNGLPPPWSPPQARSLGPAKATRRAQALDVEQGGRLTCPEACPGAQLIPSPHPHPVLMKSAPLMVLKLLHSLLPSWCVLLP
jgi:hypothetical protein